MADEVNVRAIVGEVVEDADALYRAVNNCSDSLPQSRRLVERVRRANQWLRGSPHPDGGLRTPAIETAPAALAITMARESVDQVADLFAQVESALDEAAMVAAETDVDALRAMPFRVASLLASLGTLLDALEDSPPAKPSDDGEDANTSNRRSTRAKIAEALVIQSEHPEYSMRTIAKMVGCSHGTLSRSKVFQQMRKMMANPLPPKGIRTEGGGIEAIGDDPSKIEC